MLSRSFTCGEEPGPGRRTAQEPHSGPGPGADTITSRYTGELFNLYFFLNEVIRGFIRSMLIIHEALWLEGIQLRKF